MPFNWDATWDEQASTPDTPATGKWKIYTKSDGLYTVDDAGTENGPFLADVDAGDVAYTPGTATDWDSDADPGDLDDALDQLAERVDDLEGVGADVTGPGSSTDNAIVRWDGTGGDTLQDSGITIDDSDVLGMADNVISRPVIEDYGETVNAIGAIGGGAQTIDLESGNVVTATVDTSETTFTFSNPPASGTAGSFTLILTNGGSQTVNWPAAVDWAGGTEPTLTASGVDVLTFMTVDAGTTWFAFAAGLDMS